MDLLLAIVVIIIAWLIFKSLVAVFITLGIVALAIYITRNGNHRL